MSLWSSELAFATYERGLPGRSTEPPADETVECSQCEALVHIDRAVGISIGDELFCDDACLRDWASDNLDLVVKRIRD